MLYRIEQPVQPDQKHEAQFGGYNDPPPKLKKLTQKEFAQSNFFRYTPKAIEYRQVFNREDMTEPPLSLRMYWMDDFSGIAMSEDYWNGKVTFFRFGCEHDWTGVTVEECKERGIQPPRGTWHVSKCKHCGTLWSFDSSD